MPISSSQRSQRLQRSRHRGHRDRVGYRDRDDLLGFLFATQTGDGGFWSSTSSSRRLRRLHSTSSPRNNDAIPFKLYHGIAIAGLRKSMVSTHECPPRGRRRRCSSLLTIRLPARASCVPAFNCASGSITGSIYFFLLTHSLPCISLMRFSHNSIVDSNSAYCFLFFQELRVITCSERLLRMAM